MSTITEPSRTDNATPGAEPAAPVNPAGRVLAVAAGASLVTGAVAFFAGLATSPVATDDSKTAYLESLARDPFQTQLSALFLHYGNLLMGVGLLAVPLLVRGRKGAFLTVIGALLGALGLIEMSGALLSDWFHMEIGRALPLDQGAAISDRVLAHAAEQLAFNPGPLVSLALLVTFIGVARAGVIGWWSVPAIIIGYAGLLFLPYDHPILPALGTVPMLAVLVVAGVRVLSRARTTMRVEAR